MSKKEIAKRYTLFIVSLFISALGVAITKKAELGVSPISSVANVMSIKFSVLSLGNWLIIWNCVLIAGQILILRRGFKPIQLLQIPLSFLFGWFTDLGMSMVSWINTGNMALRIVIVFAGTAVLGLGISLSVIANVIMNSGEAFVKAISDKTRFSFGNVKICFDISCVIAALILSLVFFSFSIKGSGIGTVIAAVFTGIAVKLFSKMMKEPVNRLLVKRT